jgi:ATP-dependent exoDNAse (exonuclease V) alpha subunit
MTVDRAYVLATEEASREWLYTALSRGRFENRLYGSPPAGRERDDIAPAEHGRDAAEVIELAVQRTAAQHLALDGRPASRTRGWER